MEYQVDIYEIDELNKYRFALGSLSEKTLFVFGINPSTADDKTPDPAIKNVMLFAEKHRYKSFVMFNLYPLRETFPNKLPSNPNQAMIDKNIDIIFKIISTQKDVDIWVAWGGDIDCRDYLFDCLKKIYEKLSVCTIRKWFRLDKLLRSGHPMHPSRKSHSLTFQEMDMPSYLGLNK